MATNKTKQIVSTIDLGNYLELTSLNEEMKISENGQLKFHWANWSKTCLLQKEVILGDEEKLESIDTFTQVLKNYPIWYQRNLKTVKSTLFDLYQSYMDPRLKLKWHEHQKETLVSLHHEAGPYVPLTSMRWMDKETYSLFIFKKLLTGFYPMREFRVTSDLNLMGMINCSPLNEAEVKITQFSNRGMIISVDGYAFQKVKNCQSIELKINLNSFQNVKSIKKFKYHSRKNEESLKISGDSIREHGNLRNATFSNGVTYFFFIPYSEIEILGSSKSAIQVFGNFVKSIEENFEEAISNTSLEYVRNKRRAA